MYTFILKLTIYKARIIISRNLQLLQAICTVPFMHQMETFLTQIGPI